MTNTARCNAVVATLSARADREHGAGRTRRALPYLPQDLP